MEPPFAFMSLWRDRDVGYCSENGPVPDRSVPTIVIRLAVCGRQNGLGGFRFSVLPCGITFFPEPCLKKIPVFGQEIFLV